MVVKLCGRRIGVKATLRAWRGVAEVKGVLSLAVHNQSILKH